jgi:signal transduction histidine kinase
LVAVRIRLELARELATGDAHLHGLLGEIGAGLDEAMDELRKVAHGIHPQVLTDNGLVAALAHVARNAAGPVAVTSTTLSRQPAEVKLAIYYCCREAIQNASKHGGPSVNISISPHEDAHSVGFEVSDDRPGFDIAKAASGRGLQHMRDRMVLLGGRLSIDSQAGVGTVVSGAISPWGHARCSFRLPASVSVAEPETPAPNEEEARGCRLPLLDETSSLRPAASPIRHCPLGRSAAPRRAANRT